MRRQLWPGKPSPHQRPLRLSSQQSPRSGHSQVSGEIGSGIFRRPILNICSGCVYWNWSLRPNRAARAGIAMRSGREARRRGRNPARRVALRTCTSSTLRWLDQRESSTRPPSDGLETAAGILNAARKVAILGGAGCAGAHAELIEVAGRLKAPVVHAMRGKEFIEYDNPYDVGMTGLLGFSSGYHAMMDCDALLMLGTDFPYQQFYPESTRRSCQIDLRGEQLGRRTTGRSTDYVGAREGHLAVRSLPKTRAEGGSTAISTRCSRITIAQRPRPSSTTSQPASRDARRFIRRYAGEAGERTRV